MKNVYIGKPYKNGHEVCMVIDSNIATGDALVYNRRTKAIEVIPYRMRAYVDANCRRLYQDTEEEHEKDYQRACKKYAEVIKAFQSA